MHKITNFQQGHSNIGDYADLQLYRYFRVHLLLFRMPFQKRNREKDILNLGSMIYVHNIPLAYCRLLCPCHCEIKYE
jgi:hypothetical protein